MRRPFLPALPLLLLLAGCSLFDSSTPADEPEGGEGGAVWPDDKAAELFREGRVPRFDFELSDSAWTWLNEHAADEEYVPALLRVDSAEVGTVGLRYKGSYGSLFNCIQGGKIVCERMSFKVDFDRYDSTLRLHGLKKLNLHSLRGDGSLLRDRVSYRLYREMGVHAPRAQHAFVSVNGGPAGLYGMIENVDGRFTKSRWKDVDGGEGNLYKETWPRGTNASFFENGLKTNEGASVQGMLDFSAALLQADRDQDRALLEEYVDVGRALDYLVVDVAIDNVDGYRTFYCGGRPNRVEDCSPHNFFWYERGDGRFELIPWDLNATFFVRTWLGDYPEWNDTAVSCAKPVRTGDNVFWHSACDPWFRLLRRTAAPEYRRAVERLLDGPLAPGAIEGWIDSWAGEIAADVERDTLHSVHSWRSAVDELKAVVALQRWKMERRLEGVPPAVPRLRPDGTNGFDFDPLFAPIFAAAGASAESELRASVDAESPIAGEGSLRLEWTYRNTLGGDGKPVPWGSWGGWTMEWTSPAEADLRGARAIAFDYRASDLRNFNVDILSSRYKEGVYRYWGRTFSVTPGGPLPQYLLLDSASLRYAWTGAPYTAEGDGHPPLDSILAHVTGLYLYPAQVGLDATGVYPEGKSDEGWIEIDELRVIYGD